MSTFESRNKSIHQKSLPSNVYLRIFWFAFTIQAILVSKVLYTTTSASFETRKALQSSCFFYFARTPWGEARALPPTLAFFQHINLPHPSLYMSTFKSLGLPLYYTSNSNIQSVVYTCLLFSKLSSDQVTHLRFHF